MPVALQKRTLGKTDDDKTLSLNFWGKWGIICQHLGDFIRSTDCDIIYNI